MIDATNAMEGLKLISDWAKWLITIETAAISIIGLAFKQEAAHPLLASKVWATAAIVSFVISIAAAALLLLSLPEIAQTLRPDNNVWLTGDSVIGRVFRMNTQGFAIVESFFFGVGVVCFAALILTTTWSKQIGTRHRNYVSQESGRQTS